MGGCASKPKDLDGPNPEALPADTPAVAGASVMPVDSDAPTTEAKTEPAEEATKEEPLVDLSESAVPAVRELKPETLKESGDAKEDAPGAEEAAAPVKEAATVEAVEKDGVDATAEAEKSDAAVPESSEK